MDVAIKFVSLLKNMGINFASGVPCAVQKEIIKYLSNDSDIIHIPATREEEAIGITAGAYLGEKNLWFICKTQGLEIL
ncbi:MAG: hypothetical protein QXY24_03710 [Candidatus Aenigmatarchaeota archaeon]